MSAASSSLAGNHLVRMGEGDVCEPKGEISCEDLAKVRKELTDLHGNTLGPLCDKGGPQFYTGTNTSVKSSLFAKLSDEYELSTASWKDCREKGAGSKKKMISNIITMFQKAGNCSTKEARPVEEAERKKEGHQLKEIERILKPLDTACVLEMMRVNGKVDPHSSESAQSALKALSKVFTSGAAVQWDPKQLFVNQFKSALTEPISDNRLERQLSGLMSTHPNTLKKMCKTAGGPKFTKLNEEYRVTPEDWVSCLRSRKGCQKAMALSIMAMFNSCPSTQIKESVQLAPSHSNRSDPSSPSSRPEEDNTMMPFLESGHSKVVSNTRPKLQSTARKEEARHAVNPDSGNIDDLLKHLKTLPLEQLQNRCLGGGCMFPITNAKYGIDRESWERCYTLEKNDILKDIDSMLVYFLSGYPGSATENDELNRLLNGLPTTHYKTLQKMCKTAGGPSFEKFNNDVKARDWEECYQTGVDCRSIMAARIKAMFESRQ